MNLVTKIAGKTYHLLGDPHLGKKFKTGVPVDRLGERESIVWEDFSRSLNEIQDGDTHVCLGDLFDKFIVPPEMILRVSDVYASAARKFPNSKFYVIMGNHDMSRDVDRASSFDLLEEILHYRCPDRNVLLLKKPTMSDDGQVLFLPYHPIKTSIEVLNTFLSELSTPRRFGAVMGHWDVDSFGEMPHNIFPAEDIAKICDIAYTGHVHTPEVRQYPGVTLHIVGSMQPYSFGEDPAGDFYVTMTLSEYLLKDPEDLTGMCIRIRLKPGEEPPENVNCLQLVTIRDDISDTDEDLSVDLAAFDMRRVMHESLTTAGVTDQEVMKMVFDKYEELRSSEM